MGEVATCPCCGQSVQTTELLISLQSRSISYAGEVSRLSRVKTALLNMLARAWPETVSYESILGHVIGADRDLEDPMALLRVHVMQLRQLIGSEATIETVRGVGYRLVLPAQAVVNKNSVRRRQSDTATN